MDKDGQRWTKMERGRERGERSKGREDVNNHFRVFVSWEELQIQSPIVLIVFPSTGDTLTEAGNHHLFPKHILACMVASLYLFYILRAKSVLPVRKDSTQHTSAATSRLPSCTWMQRRRAVSSPSFINSLWDK